MDPERGGGEVSREAALVGEAVARYEYCAGAGGRIDGAQRAEEIKFPSLVASGLGTLSSIHSPNSERIGRAPPRTADIRAR